MNPNRRLNLLKTFLSESFEPNSKLCIKSFIAVRSLFLEISGSVSESVGFVFDV